MEKFMIEACVDSVDSAIIAVEAGADRIELCSNLVIGGTTPGLSMFREIRRQCDTLIHVLIRPRFGDFLYTEREFSVIKDEVRQFQEAGADGVVIGCLSEDGSLDRGRMEELIKLSGDMKITLHRAFDVARNPFQTLEEAISLGIHRILTSGQANTALEGVELLRELEKKADGRVKLLAGSGVNEKNIGELYEKTGILEYHLSGKKVLESGMKFRKEGVSMGLPSMSEYEIWRTDGEKIRRAIEVLKNRISIEIAE